MQEFDTTRLRVNGVGVRSHRSTDPTLDDDESTRHRRKRPCRRIPIPRSFQDDQVFGLTARRVSGAHAAVYGSPRPRRRSVGWWPGLRGRVDHLPA